MEIIAFLVVFGATHAPVQAVRPRFGGARREKLR
jgi:hypothetical protein